MGVREGGPHPLQKGGPHPSQAGLVIEAASTEDCPTTRKGGYGRFRYLGEQTLGKPDPGAYVTVLIFVCLYEVARQTDKSTAS